MSCLSCWSMYAFKSAFSQVCQKAQTLLRFFEHAACRWTQELTKLKYLQVERINDESVKLKTLQTSLTLMQIPELAQNEVCISCEALGLHTSFKSFIAS